MTTADDFSFWNLPESEELSRAVADFITGMTDRYALRMYQETFLPRRWVVF